MPNLANSLNVYHRCAPIGNDLVERVFSLLKRIWRNDRNRMSIDLIKAEICINVNFNMDCIEFKSYIISNETLNISKFYRKI